jgi:hypothetical protein
VPGADAISYDAVYLGLSAAVGIALPCGCVPATVVILSLGGRARRRSANQGLPGDFSGFFARLLEVTVISPQMGPVFAAMHEDTAGPRCPDAYNLVLGSVTGGM